MLGGGGRGGDGRPVCLGDTLSAPGLLPPRHTPATFLLLQHLEKSNFRCLFKCGTI